MPPKLEAPTTISVPSADLINYRFDVTDQKFREMNTKLDTILMQTAHFVSEDQVSKMITEALAPTKETITTWRWYWRAIVSAVLLALAAAIASIFIHRA